MPEPTQIEPVAQTGNEGSGDPAFDAALAEAAGTVETPAVETPALATATETPGVETPIADPDFTFATLENGQREMRTATGQVYRGKDDAELLTQLGKAQVAASRRITELSRPQEAVAPTQAAAAAIPEAIDPTALAIADLMAPAFGVKNGAELVAAFAEQQRIAQSQQEFQAAQQANFEAANFFRAVPEFSKSQADADKIDSFLQTNQLPFNAKTAEMAYYTLKAKGELTAAPVATRTAAPVNNMPPPPAGTAPANTGKGAPTETDLWAMTADQLAELLTAGSTQ